MRRTNSCSLSECLLEMGEISVMRSKASDLSRNRYRSRSRQTSGILDDTRPNSGEFGYKRSHPSKCVRILRLSKWPKFRSHDESMKIGERIAVVDRRYQLVEIN